MLRFKNKIISLSMIATLILVSQSGVINTLAAQQTEDNFVSNTSVSQYIEKDLLNKNLNYSKITLLDEKSDFKQDDVLSFDINLNEDLIYNLSMIYKANEEIDSVIKIEIDGKSPFDEAERLIFPCFWKNKNEIKSDKNMLFPDQVLNEGYFKSFALDYSGKSEKPYVFELKQGVHNIKLISKQGFINVSNISFETPENVSKYSFDKSKNSDLNGIKTIILEGENANVKNNRSITPMEDSSSPLVNPSNPVNSQQNYIGGDNWSSPGQSVGWDFEVEKSGYYNIAFNYRKNQSIGSVCFRHLMIDGVTPFTEAERIKFKYSDKWKFTEYTDEKDNPYYVWLDKGKHTVSLSVTPGVYANIYSEMSSTAADMGDLYVDITKIVGETVDIYRSYELFKQIPKFNDRLTSVYESLNQIIVKMQKAQGSETSSDISIIKDAARVVKSMIDNPYSSHKFKDQFYSSYTNISSLMSSMMSMPMDIDRIYFIGKGNNYEPDRVSIGEKISFSFKRFITTYYSDYNTIASDDVSENERLTIWVNWGLDQAKALNSVIEGSFVKEYNIPVKVSLANATLIQAILSGKGPDVMLQMARTEPVNLAMRGALVELSQFEGYDDVVKRFSDNATLPYEYNGGTYALPDTQTYFLMFVRNDVFSSLGLEPPKTWDDFVRIASVLQRNNLQVSLPYTQLTNSGTVNTGVGGLTLYPTLLIQKNLSIYNNELNKSIISNSEQQQVFVDWCSWYNKYKMPTITDFYNRFRIGSAPLGISTYTLYTQLKAAAPEIDGRWSVYLLPGTDNGDGVINNSSAGAGTGCSITKLSNNKENAWKFLDWWTSADTQLHFSNTLESVLGPLGRVASSNKEAIKKMGWDTEALKIIEEQQKLTVEIPEIPGGYYTARGIDQAFWSVIEQSAKPVDVLNKWNKIVNNEIKRKMAEYKPE